MRDTRQLVTDLDALRTYLFTDRAVIDAIGAISDIPLRHKVLGARMDFYTAVDRLINVQLASIADAFEQLEPALRAGMAAVRAKAEDLQRAADAIAVAAAIAGLAASIASMLL